MIPKAEFSIKVGHGTEVQMSAYGEVGYREARLAAVSFLKKMAEMYGGDRLSWLTALCHEAMRGHLQTEEQSAEATKGWKQLKGKEFRHLRFTGKQKGVDKQLSFIGDEWREQMEGGKWLHNITGQFSPPFGLSIGCEFDFLGDKGEDVRFVVLSEDGDVKSQGFYHLPEEKADSDIEVG